VSDSPDRGAATGPCSISEPAPIFRITGLKQSEARRLWKIVVEEMMIRVLPLVLACWITTLLVPRASAFFAPVVVPTSRQWGGVSGAGASHFVQNQLAPGASTTAATTPRFQPLFLFDKLFEEEGPLGKGITVGKISVALISEDRGKDSIFGLLEDNARWIAGDDEAGSLADLAHEVCLSLLRKQDSWTAASSDSKWFGADDYGKAESLFNESISHCSVVDLGTCFTFFSFVSLLFLTNRNGPTRRRPNSRRYVSFSNIPRHFTIWSDMDSHFAF